MDKLIKEYKLLQSDLVNLGDENTFFEVFCNDIIVESMKDILKQLPNSIANALKLNHI